MTKDKILAKNSTKTATWKLVSDLFVFGKNKQNFYWKMKFLKQASYIRYVIAKLSESVQTACRPHQTPFYRGFFQN